MTNPLNRLNERIMYREDCGCVECMSDLGTLKALKASREFFEKTMEADYGEDIGEIMQQWDEVVGRELE